MRLSPDLRHSPLCILALFLVTLAWAGPASSRTWYVKQDGSGDVPTIQAAVDSAAVGDVILVAPGRYTWANQGGGDPTFGMINIYRGRDRFTLKSEGGPMVTTLDAQRQNRVIFIQGYNHVTIEGFTITGGSAPAANPAGGGLACHLSSDTIRNCRFIDNMAQSGGALWNGGVSTMHIEGCEFRYNTAYIGGALYFVNSSSTQTIQDCIISNNSSTSHAGGIYAVNDALDIQRTIFYYNVGGGSGGALGARSMHASSMTSCTLVYNQSYDGGGLYLNDCLQFSVDRCIIAWQAAGAAFATYSSSVITLTCTDTWSNPGGNNLPAGSIDGGGNFQANPMFCGTVSSEDYRINAISPCADGHHPDGAACGLIGALDIGCGSVKTEATSWGHLKSMYRE